MKAASGYVRVDGRIASLLELGAGFNPEFTGRENVLLNGAMMSIPEKEMLQRIAVVEAFADIGPFFDQPVKKYSSGMFARLAFSTAIHVDPDILIIDEALSVGDVAFQHRCYNKMREFMALGKTMLFVSHNTDILLKLCQRGIVLDGGKVQYVGSIKPAIECYQNLMSGNEANPLSEQGKKNVMLSSMTAEESDDVVHLKRHYNKHEVRLGSLDVKIIDYDIIADSTINPSVIPSGASVELIVKLKFEKKIDDVSIGFAVVSVEGVYAFGTNLDMMHEDFISGAEGEVKVVSFNFTSSLAGGEYFLNIGSHHYINGEQKFLDIRRSVAKFITQPTPKQIGFANLDVNFNVSQ